ncbi:unnamed protein product [Dicrocoelium dendriticum]|nr:unnamed protein product [Dicrocoelium dendriticum]
MRVKLWLPDTQPCEHLMYVRRNKERLLNLATTLSIRFAIHDRHGRLLAIGVILLGQAASHSVIVAMILLRLPVWLFIIASLVSGIIGGGMISLCVQMTVCFTDLIALPPHTDVPNELTPLSTENRQDRRRLLLLGIFDSGLSLSAALANVVADNEISPSTHLVGFSIGSFFVFLYLMAKPFCWSPEYVGLYNGLSGFLTSITTLALILCTYCSMRMRHLVHSLVSSSEHPSPPMRSDRWRDEECEPLLLPALPPTDSRAVRHIWTGRFRAMVYILVAFVIITVSKLVMGVVFMLPAPQRTILVFISLLLQLARSSVIPTLKSFLSSLHSPDSQGYLFSLIGLFEYLGAWIGLPCLPGVYALTVHVFPGAVFLLSAGLAAIGSALAAILLCFVCKRIPRTTSV